MAGRALLIVDMLTAYDFEDADRVVESARDAVPAIAELRARFTEAQSPVLFVNDNYGHWNSSREELLRQALEGAHRELVEPLVPDADDLFIHKARHSVFYGTPLEYLLRQLEIDDLVLTGQVTEQCILYSALDAYVRHFQVTVVRDGVAHIDAQLGGAALEMMRRNMRAQIVDANDCETG
jgi:nicotinamidase-related amidase